MVASKPFDTLVYLSVLLQIASLGKFHVAEIALERLDLGVTAHVRCKLAQGQQNSLTLCSVVLTTVELVDTVAVGASDCVLGELV